MSVQSAIEHDLPLLRAEAEARMTARCTVRRETGQMAQDEDTGREVPAWAAVYSDVPLQILPGVSYRTVNVAGVERTIAVRTDAMPALVNGVPLDLRDNDHLDIVTSEGHALVHRILEAEGRDFTKSRRVPVVAVDRPEEWS